MNAEIVMVETRWVRLPEEAISAVGRLDARLPTGEPSLGNRSFFEGKSIRELAESQGGGLLQDIRVFAGGIPDDEDIDEMLEEIYRLREP